ncbi:hypothetical protein EMMF5_004593 [Cystobasidiomycetes sp. EMM_F5]
MTADPALAGAALLVLANKQDVRGCEACRLIYEVVTLIFPLQVNDAVRLYPSGPSVTFRYVLSKACCGVVTIGRWEQVYELDELSAHQKEHTAYSTSSIVPWIIKIDLVSSSSDPSATFFEGEKHFAALGIDVNSLEVEATCGRISVMTLVKDDSAVDGRSYMTQPTLMPAEQLLSQLHDAQMTNPFASMYDKVCGMFGSHSSTSGYVKI